MKNLLTKRRTDSDYENIDILNCPILNKEVKIVSNAFHFWRRNWIAVSFQPEWAFWTEIIYVLMCWNLLIILQAREQIKSHFLWDQLTLRLQDMMNSFHFRCKSDDNALFLELYWLTTAAAIGSSSVHLWEISIWAAGRTWRQKALPFFFSLNPT
jgi:hypothetical protein